MTFRVLIIASLLAGMTLADTVSTSRPAVIGDRKAIELAPVGAYLMIPESSGVRPQPGGKLVLYDLYHRNSVGERMSGLLEVRVLDQRDVKDLAGLVDSVKRRIEKNVGQNYVINVLRDGATTFGGRPAWQVVYDLANPVSRKVDHRRAEILYFDGVGRSIRLSFASSRGQWDLLDQNVFQPVLESVTWAEAR